LSGCCGRLFAPGVAAAFLLWQSYGWLAQRPGPTAQSAPPPDAIELAAPAAPFAEKFDAISFDLDTVGLNKIATTVAAGQTATGVDLAPAAKASGVMVESQGDAPSLQPTERLNIKPTEAKPLQPLSERGKPRPRGSDHRSERAARKDVMVGTTENGVSTPPAPRGRAGPWDGGLP